MPLQTSPYSARQPGEMTQRLRLLPLTQGTGESPARRRRPPGMSGSCRPLWSPTWRLHTGTTFHLQSTPRHLACTGAHPRRSPKAPHRDRSDDPRVREIRRAPYRFPSRRDPAPRGPPPGGGPDRRRRERRRRTRHACCLRDARRPCCCSCCRCRSRATRLGARIPRPREASESRFGRGQSAASAQPSRKYPAAAGGQRSSRGLSAPFRRELGTTYSSPQNAPIQPKTPVRNPQ